MEKLRDRLDANWSKQPPISCISVAMEQHPLWAQLLAYHQYNHTVYNPSVSLVT
jgi:hypothetical protein